MPVETPPPERPPGPWRPRFTILALMLVTLVCAVASTAGFYFFEAMRQNSSPRAVFVLIVLATPVLLMTLLSGMLSVIAWLNRRK